jgi:putative colanic acid biosynthesis UDP-glucose lipid carrier transferase
VSVVEDPSGELAGRTLSSWVRAPGPVDTARIGPAAGRAITKRGLDLVLSLLLLLFLTPLLISIAVLIRATSDGPALFRQRRSGLDGRVFKVLKFRTMTVMEDGAVRAVRRGDVRVTAIGAILRRTSLDELPQLINVLRGEMSLVGPRPHAVSHDRQFSLLAPAYPARFRTRPGLTGLAQISGHRGEIRTRECLLARLEADLRYIRDWSLLLDLKILAMTALMVLLDRKAY